METKTEYQPQLAESLIRSIGVEEAVYEGFLMQMQLQAQSLGNIVVRGLGVWVTLLAGMYLFG